MNTGKIKFQSLPSLLAGLLLALSPLSGAHAADAELDHAVAQGKDLFSHANFGGSGKVCESCHLGGGREPGRLPNGKAIPSLTNAAAIFPRFQQRSGKVITLTDQIRSCATNALEGTPPEYGSEQLNSLASYITSLAQGKPVNMGGTPQ